MRAFTLQPFAFWMAMVAVAATGRAEDAASTAVPPVAPLSVAPLDHVVHPASRPNWIDNATTPRRMVIESGPCESADEARDTLESMLPGAVRTLAISSLDVLPDSFDPIQQDRVSDYVARLYTGEVRVGDVRHFEAAAEVQIDDEDIRVFNDRARSVETLHRIAAAGVCTTALATMLAGSGGLLGWIGRRRSKNSIVS